MDNGRTNTNSDGRRRRRSNNWKKRKFSEGMKMRLLVALGVFMAVFVLVVFNLFKTNVIKGEEYTQMALNSLSFPSSEIFYKRGDILDSNGNVLATTKKIYKLILEPKNILEYEDKRISTIQALKGFFAFTDDEIADFLENENSYYVVAKKDIEYETTVQFKEYCANTEIRGVYFEEGYERVYPNGSLACHVIGFTGKDATGQDNEGLYGLEYQYSDYLNGTNGRSYAYLDENSSHISSVEEPVDGYNIVTSIDANIQKIVEKKVDAYMEEEGAKNVSVLVMDPNNCNVLALYNSHPYDLNSPAEYETLRYQFETDQEYEVFKSTATNDEVATAFAKLYRNFAVSDTFEPGSTYKTFTIAGALEEALVTPEDTFYCDGGESKSGVFIRCHSYYSGGHGTIDLSGALEQSCNDALMTIAEREGAATFDKYQTLFGFGQRTGIDMPGEESDASLSALIYHEENLNDTELATSSFGQSASVTMMQLGTAFCSVVNGGNYYTPSIVQKIVDNDGNIIEDRESILVRKTISKEVSEIMKDELRQVLIKGTGRKAAVEGYDIGGKTGTAEKLPRGQGNYLISFIGFAPVDNPEVVVYVVVDEPKVEDQSSSAASSYLFADIAEELFPYMNIYKSGDDYDIDSNTTPDEPAVPIYGDTVPDSTTGDDGDDNPDDRDTAGDGNSDGNDTASDGV